MLTSRERVIRTLNHEPVDQAPRDLWVLPGIEMFREDELAEMNFRYPSDFINPDFCYPPGDRAGGIPYQVGQYTDAWGCTWQVAQRGTIGQINHSPLADPARIADYRLPEEILTRARFDRVNRGCAATSRFVLARTEVRPFERMQLLRGAEATLLDLADGSKTARGLLARLHEFYCREIQSWAETDVDGLAFMDDWGSQLALLVSGEIWRDLFKPLYREYCKIIHQGDKFAFFHSDGNIAEIFPDLIEIGIDAVNSQLFLMNLESLAEKFRGQITFWGEIDRHRVLPHGTPDEVRDAVYRVRRALDFGQGGVIAQCQWGPDVPFRNIASVFERWMEPMPVHA